MTSERKNGIIMSLQDDHIWNLAQRFVEESQIWTLGLKVLKLPEHQVASIWHIHKQNANLTARQLLQKWSLQYKDSTEAYTTLCDTLEEAGLGHFVAHLREWNKEIRPPSDLTEKRMYLAYCELFL